ncbi:hypothetical protein GM921_16795 [Pedobacter sp. LMG 31464]|uniref:Uncharacterized protein n=1 Tax=Pedobacter planticolens TaxID=2679964 RepID=A0A923E1V5_9SPHI|nr:hypothetical protein [Pedobacter planticolens]MBB2147160.1 hypothetical protein [Pedobacter planticolens]
MIKDFLKNLFNRKNTNDLSNHKIPAGWYLTVSDLHEELRSGKRIQFGESELTWAREYERSLIPENYRFPRKGDLYQAKFDQEIDYITDWSAPYSGGGKAKIYVGEKFWVHTNPSDKKPIGAYLIPVNYKDLEERIIPFDDRTAFKYNGYYFYVRTNLINENFILDKTGFQKEKYI